MKRVDGYICKKEKYVITHSLVYIHDHVEVY